MIPTTPSEEGLRPLRDMDRKVAEDIRQQARRDAEVAVAKTREELKKILQSVKETESQEAK